MPKKDLMPLARLFKKSWIVVIFEKKKLNICIAFYRQQRLAPVLIIDLAVKQSPISC
ncbi:hypothetical protein [Neomoorella thermoacetica]|uniref:hypothetical protein n=1 Tax=Neomoorella thermoacetica TaxID=1525 RepID=UPI0030D5A66D